MRNLSFIAAFVILGITAFAQSPHGGSFKTECIECHTTSSWKIDPGKMSFTHSSTGFELIGQHKNVDCRSCHSTLIFNQAKQECSSCHNDAHKSSVSPDCAKCHSPKSWLVTDVNSLHQNSRFPLFGRHKTADCIQCHTRSKELNYEAAGIGCYDCHASDYNITRNPSHLAAGFSKECETCHNMSGAGWSFASFAHTTFPLQGGHKRDNCYDCHKTSTFSGLSRDCFACHNDNFAAAANPNHVQNNFSTSCNNCHNINAWKPATFDHAATGFQLTGRHITTACASCHTSGYASTPNDCKSCHINKFNSAANPNHIAAAFPQQCEQCHTTNNWSVSNFNHTAYTSFALTGKHITATCNSCHQAGFANTPQDCNSCHNDDYGGTSNPNHLSANFPVECQSCHTTNGWTPAQFDHDQRYFPIYSGKHRGEWSSCASCHTNSSNYAVFSCVTCHEHNRTDMDNEHRGVNGYVYSSAECLSCHPNGDGDRAFNHGTSLFPLTGAHANSECRLCHVQGYASAPAKECIACHETERNAGNNPSHTLAHFSDNCTECHTTSAWKPSSFKHTVEYPLTGAHSSAKCIDCHPTAYQNTSPACNTCHNNDYTAASQPGHSSAGIPLTCENCHNNISWKPSTFDHGTSGFQLAGGHNRQQCSDCHTGSTSGTSNLCYSCHQSDFSSAVNPNHTNAGIAQTCENCHTNVSWIPSTFDHAVSGFQLTGGHNIQQCSECHSGTTSGASDVCSTCHQNDFNSAANPNHLTLALPNTCGDCHTTNPGWTPASFPVHNNYFVLQGAHFSIRDNCSQCHSGNYTTTSNTCYGCHTSDFNSTTNPNHLTQQYPHECTECHSQSAWTPSTFNHDQQYFPIYSGKHRNKWTNCAQCHPTPSNYAAYSCVTCHEHNQTSMNQEHQGVQGYVYLSSACFDCHPDGDSKKVLKHGAGIE